MVRKCLPIMGIVLWIGAAEAGPRTRVHCAKDYLRYCVKVSLDDRRALTACMNRNAKRLSSGCVEALIEDGYVTKNEVERRRR
jgi:hypothetical protein